MKQIIYTITVVLILTVLSCSGVLASNKGTPPGSFVRQRAVSVSQLVQQVRKDAIVRQRYAKHFGISSNAVADHFEKNLKLVSLKKPLRATVWYVDKKGSIHTKTKLLPKGTSVFVDKTGNPVIIWSCGNPLVKKLAKPIVEKEKEQVKAAPIEVLGTEPIVDVLAPPPDAPPTTTQELLQPTPAEVAVLPPLEIPAPVVEPAAVIDVLPTISVGGSPSGIGALLASGSVPIIGSIIGGGGSKKGGGGGETVIPEVPGAMVMVVGLGALGMLRRLQINKKR